MEIEEEMGVEGFGQSKWLIISSSMNEGYLVMTITLTKTMRTVSRYGECNCSHVDSVYVVKKM